MGGGEMRIFSACVKRGGTESVPEEVLSSVVGHNQKFLPRRLGEFLSCACGFKAGVCLALFQLSIGWDWVDSLKAGLVFHAYIT